MVWGTMEAVEEPGQEEAMAVAAVVGALIVHT